LNSSNKLISYQRPPTSPGIEGSGGIVGNSLPYLAGLFVLYSSGNAKAGIYTTEGTEFIIIIIEGKTTDIPFIKYIPPVGIINPKELNPLN
jgi:hypothetical protein